MHPTILETGLVDHNASLILFFALVIGHMLGDYPLQGEFLAIGKNHKLPKEERVGPYAPKGIWIHCLTAHAAIHAGLVWLITGSSILAVAEFVAHWVIDYLKSEGVTSFHVDQVLHIICKATYVVLLAQGIVEPDYIGNHTGPVVSL